MKINSLPSHQDIIGSMSDTTPSGVPSHEELMNILSPEKPKGNIAQRHNNPGNLVFVGQEGATAGEDKGDGVSWAKFNTPEEGWAAFNKDAEIKLKRNPKMTVAEYIDMRSPGNENDTKKLHLGIAQSLQHLKDEGKIKTLLLNKITMTPELIDEVNRAAAKMEGFFAEIE